MLWELLPRTGCDFGGWHFRGWLFRGWHLRASWEKAAVRRVQVLAAAASIPFRQIPAARDGKGLRSIAAVLNSVTEKPGRAILAQGLKPHGRPWACSGRLWSAVIACSCRDLASSPLRHGTNAAQSQTVMGKGGSSTCRARGVGHSPGAPPGSAPPPPFVPLLTRGGGRGKMVSEGRKRNQLLFFIFDKVIKARSPARAGVGQPLPGASARRGPRGSFGGSSDVSPSPAAGNSATPPWRNLPPSLAAFPFGRKTGIPAGTRVPRRGWVTSPEPRGTEGGRCWGRAAGSCCS